MIAIARWSLEIRHDVNRQEAVFNVQFLGGQMRVA
jgi:hypothetical protein